MTYAFEALAAKVVGQRVRPTRPSGPSIWGTVALTTMKSKRIVDLQDIRRTSTTGSVTSLQCASAEEKQDRENGSSTMRHRQIESNRHRVLSIEASRVCALENRFRETWLA